MSIIYSASAPGKIVLSGEYAVLDGVPAISMAVNRRAKATLLVAEGAADETGEISTPGFSASSSRFLATANGIEWLGEGTEVKVLDCVWRALGSEVGAPFSVRLDTVDFVDPQSGTKVGIGSSAAITTALCAAFKNTHDVGSLAQRAHLELQDGRGSGIDVACSLTGGLIQYRMEGASVTKIDWPKGLLCRLIWTGVAADTRAKLARLDDALSKPPRARLARAAEDMAIVWRQGQAADVINENRNYTRQLRAFGDAYGLGIFDAGHEYLWSAANKADLSYKPCGAGGGDVGMLLGTDAAALDVFVDRLAAPFAAIDCSIDYAGVQVERPDQA